MDNLSIPCAVPDAGWIGQADGAGIVDVVVCRTDPVRYGYTVVVQANFIPGGCTIHGTAHVLAHVDTLRQRPEQVCALGIRPYM